MSVIVLRGSAANWGEAALEHLSTVENYARRTLRNLDTVAYWVDRTVTYYFHVARTKWEPGKDLRLRLYLLVARSKQYASREQSRRPLAQQVKEMIEALDTVIDVREAIRKLDDRSQKIVILLAQGFTWKEVEEQTGWSIWMISKVREELGRLLADYQPVTPPKKRGRGRPRRTE